MKKICILTATRAEYGLLSPVIKKLNNIPEFDVRVVVTGMHLSPEFGLTYREIENDGVNIDRKIEMLLSADTPSAITKSMGVALMGFADYFAEINPDALVVLGDRYETLAVCIAAMNEKIPIFHIHGGETTEGLIDEAIRHAITKMSMFHFTSTEQYRKRVIQLGEHPSRVFNVGALGVENVLSISTISKEELGRELGINLDTCYAVGTYHPVTLEEYSAEKQVMELIHAIEKNAKITFIFTKANADQNGATINKILDDYTKKLKNLYLFDSLGVKKYLSVVKGARFVIGNSSSGLIEVPSFGIPTIDIGDRQRGRVSGDSVIHCKPEFKDIDKAINMAMSSEFRQKIVNAPNPYGTGNVSDKICQNILLILSKKNDLKKKFYDLYDGVLA